MWSSGRRVLQDLLRQSSARTIYLSPVQHTVIVERWWQVPLSKVGSPPRLYARRHNIYKLVEDTRHSPKEDMELILTETLPRLGKRGDTVFVKKSYGRNKLLARGLAVYPSPENKQMFAEELKISPVGRSEANIQTRTGQLTIEFLQSSNLEIMKTLSDEFQLTKDVVCRQLDRKLGVVVPLHALTLPFEPIKELGDYWCDVTVNGLDTVRIPMSLLPYKDISAGGQTAKKVVVGEVSVEKTTSADTQTNHDTTAPPSESPDKN
ncbi:39S ribosomal protein L9, mitochondrial [Nematolebias whitei]|uniref:39S ribosomal protein L9, mitochondrial n=1 Tax=Nematolebias whitei TaxID=451745 RepID=UPI001897A8D8|nr:39S ribosomal protein L9, mitochondrial [Nematolebias whitei]